MSTLQTRRIPIALARLAGAAALTAAAFGFGGRSAAAETTGSPGSLGNVSLTVLSPTPGEVVTGPSLPVRVYANGYRLDASYAGTPSSSSIGHYHEILDGHLIDMTPLQNPGNDSISLAGVSPGWHTFYAVLVGNDHMPFMTAAGGMPPTTVSSVRLYVQSSA
jgi:hypothetical protein